MADDPAWFEDEFPTDGRRPRRRVTVLVALIAASWIVLALVLVRSHGAAPTATATEGRSTRVDQPDPDAADASGHDPRGQDPPGAVPGDDAGGTPVTDPGAEAGAAAPPLPEEAVAPVSRDEAEAVAVAVLRGWLSDGGPDLPVPGVAVDRRAYLEHVALEAFDVPSDELAVARMLVVLLLRDGDRYTEAVVRRAAVPLTLATTSVRPGGRPWWLPTGPDLTPDPPDATPVTTAATVADVTAALTAAGYLDATVAEVATTAGGTFVADVTARTPDGDPVEGPVWLHPSPDGLLVLGGPHLRDGSSEAPRAGEVPPH